LNVYVVGSFAIKLDPGVKQVRTLFAILGLAAALAAAPIKSISVQETGGRKITYSKFEEKVSVVVFVSTRCPISNAFNFRLNALYKEFAASARFIVLDPNANESLEEIRIHAANMEYDFPVYKDPDNLVADLLGAKATPDSFVIDRSGSISYHGYIEDSPSPQRAKIQGLRLAIEAALQNRPAPLPETHARGCAIRRSQPSLR